MHIEINKRDDEKYEVVINLFHFSTKYEEHEAETLNEVFKIIKERVKSKEAV